MDPGVRRDDGFNVQVDMPVVITYPYHLPQDVIPAQAGTHAEARAPCCTFSMGHGARWDDSFNVQVEMSVVVRRDQQTAQQLSHSTRYQLPVNQSMRHPCLRMRTIETGCLQNSPFSSTRKGTHVIASE
jgi:hypothetical protein